MGGVQPQAMAAPDPMQGLAWAIALMARMQNKTVDRLRLHESVSKHQAQLAALAQVQADGPEVASSNYAQLWQNVARMVATSAGVQDLEILEAPDAARLPALTWLPGAGWAVIRHRTADNQWLLDQQGVMRAVPIDQALPCVRLVLAANDSDESDKPAERMIRAEFLKQKPVLVESGLAGVMINLLALGVSLYSMQVYDRVIPTQGYSTLGVLTLGVAIALVFDIVIKFARSYLMESAITQMDSSLSRQIFTRFLNVRLDQLPGSVGSLSAQLRGYETIRAFLSASTFYLFVDAPFGLFFILMIALVGSPIIALVPLGFLLLSLAFGFVMRQKIDAHAAKSTDATNKKTGILVETIEGAETIKSGGGAWNALSKWIDTNDEALVHDMALRSISEKSNYLSAMLQQVSYVGLIAAGAYFASEGHMTMGSLIACSILSGRAMAPVTQIPGLMVQAAHAKAALRNLERVFSLESDNHAVDRPLIPQLIRGQYHLERIRYAYPNAPKALQIQNLHISPGEKIGVIGPVGAGKSTFLRILTGMHQAGEGRVLLDGLDIDQISRAFLSERIGYLQQDHRLFSGTLRENLLIGIPDPGDDVIRNVAEQTGLLAVIANHPKGLDLMIAEGGKGLSGGQRQLVAFTRLLLSKPNVWLLDEPTASMDNNTELRSMTALKTELRPEDTLVLVTHKPHLLAMTNRLIVIAQHQIIMDGPRDEVLKKLAASNVPQKANPGQATTAQSTTHSTASTNTQDEDRGTNPTDSSNNSAGV